MQPHPVVYEAVAAHVVADPLNGVRAAECADGGGDLYRDLTLRVLVNDRAERLDLKAKASTPKTYASGSDTRLTTVFFQAFHLGMRWFAVIKDPADGKPPCVRIRKGPVATAVLGQIGHDRIEGIDRPLGCFGRRVRNLGRSPDLSHLTRREKLSLRFCGAQHGGWGVDSSHLRHRTGGALERIQIPLQIAVLQHPSVPWTSVRPLPCFWAVLQAEGGWK